MTQIQGITSQQIPSTTTSAPAEKLSRIDKVINAVKTFFKNSANGAVDGYDTWQNNYVVQKISPALGILAAIFKRPPSYINSRIFVSELTSRGKDGFHVTGIVKETSAWCGAIIGAFKGAIRGNKTKTDSASFDDTQNLTASSTPVEKAIPATTESPPSLSKQIGKVTKFIEPYFRNATAGAATGKWLGRKVGLLVGLADVSRTANVWIRNEKGQLNKSLQIIPALILTPICIGAAKELYGVLGTVGGAAIGSIAHAVRKPEETDVKPKTTQPEQA